MAGDKVVAFLLLSLAPAPRTRHLVARQPGTFLLEICHPADPLDVEEKGLNTARHQGPTPNVWLRPDFFGHRL